MKRTNLTLIGFVLLFATACNDHGYTEFDKETFHTHWEKWLDMQIIDYRFRVSYFADAGPEEAIIHVKNGSIQSVEMIPDMPHSFCSRFHSVTAMYEDIASAYADHSEQIKNREIQGVTVKIKYNARYHFPEEVNYYVTYDEAKCDGYWYSLKITGFTVL